LAIISKDCSLIYYFLAILNILFVSILLFISAYGFFVRGAFAIICFVILGL